MAVSGFFSLIVYRGFTKELGRGFRYSQNITPQKHYLVQQQNGLMRILPFWIYPEEVAPDEYLGIINLAKHRFSVQLIFINGIILILSGTAGYFLAGKTLYPIEEMVREQKRFIADASHELRTPLTSIKTEAEVALRDNNLKLSEAKELLKSNLQEADKMKGLTDYLLSLSKYEANIVDMKMEKVNLSEILKTAVEKNLPLAKAKHIMINQDLKNITLKGNYQSLVELFSIVINNSIKYSPDKSVIKVSCTIYRKKADIKISDQGMGISKKDLPHIFDRFYRSDTSRSKSDTDGFGLGLAIAKSIAEVHQGNINVQSTVNKGSVFNIILPL